MKKGTVLTVIVLALLAAAAVFGPAFAGGKPPHVKVDVCHATESESNPFVIVNVSVHSVDDATGLNGHGDHEDDSWASFVFDGVTYPGQGDFPGRCADEPEEPTSTPTPVVTEPPDEPTPTPTEEDPCLENPQSCETPTEEPTPTETPTDEPTPTEPPTIERLPDTGWSDSFVPGVVAWQITDNAWAVHQGVPGGYEIALWNQGYAYDFEGMRVVVRGSVVVSPDDVSILNGELPGRADLILITCTNLHDGIWHNRLVLYVEVLR